MRGFTLRPNVFSRSTIPSTPELKAEGLKKLEGWARGPLFTPPSEKGTLGLPSAGGGANWHGAAFDPETGIMYIPSNTTLASFSVTKPDPSRSNLDFVTGWTNAGPPRAVKGLPIVKPPYSRVTAIDLNTGEHEWMTPHGDGPIDNPALEGIDTGPLGAQGSGNGPLLTKSLLFVTQGAAYLGSERDKQHKITVFDKKTGEILGKNSFACESVRKSDDVYAQWEAVHCSCRWRRCVFRRTGKISGAQGTFFEVTPKGKEVWRYVNPAYPIKPDTQKVDKDGNPKKINFMNFIVFRIYRYPHDYSAFKGKNLTPGLPLTEYLEENPTKVPLDLSDELALNEVLDE